MREALRLRFACDLCCPLSPNPWYAPSMRTVAGNPSAISQLETSEPIEVPKILGKDQVQAYVDLGYITVSGLVTDEEIEELQADILKLARGEYPCKSLEPLPATVSDEEALCRILCLHQPHNISPVILKYVKHPNRSGADRFCFIPTYRNADDPDSSTVWSVSRLL